VTSNANLDVDVWRGAAQGAYRRYEVPRQDSQTVLDVVTWIQRRLDPTLAYRFACRVGMCGSCAMTVNGKARWTCRTHVVAWNPAYLGPAALNRAWTLVNDSRDGGQAVRLAAVAGDAGCHACHTQSTCTERCPKLLSPTASIAGLKRATVRAALKGGL